LIAILIEGSEMLEAVNVVFGKLAADVLRSALTNCGRSEDIVVFPDDLSCGPLNPLGDARETWMQNNLYLSPGDWGVFPRQLGDLFNNLKFQHGRIICWVCPNSVNEFCGFQQCIEQIAGDLYYVNTMAAAQFEQIGNPDEGFPPRLAHITPEIAVQLIGKEIPLSESYRAGQLKNWQRRRAENAALRIIGAQGIQSVSLSYFDPLLLAFADAELQPARWVITQAAVEANSNNFFRADMMILTGRLRALVKQGQLFADGDVMDREVRIRLR
jgi:hypothetical protein